MARFLFVALSFIFIFSSLLDTIALGQQDDSRGCIQCHEETYVKAISRPYLHSVVKDTCTMCHIIQKFQSEREKKMTFSSLQRENILHLGNLEADKEYKMEVIARDADNRKSEPVTMKIMPHEVWEFRETRPSIKQISAVAVEEIKRMAFVQAAISWNTDVFATSEIEYRTGGKYPERVAVDNAFSKVHKITLNRLKQKHTYRFRIISKDINGNVLRSKEYTLDTSEELTHTINTVYTAPIPPNIDFIRVFKIEGKEGLYMKVATNRPSSLLVSLKEIQNTDDKHGFGLTEARFSRIDVCYTCHPQNASHPVGVKIEGPKVVMPDDLPTIGDGILTCVTCHFAHGGEKLYFARIDFKRGKGICIKCHPKYYR